MKQVRKLLTNPQTGILIPLGAFALIFLSIEHSFLSIGSRQRPFPNGLRNGACPDPSGSPLDSI